MEDRKRVVYCKWSHQVAMGGRTYPLYRLLLSDTPRTPKEGLTDYHIEAMSFDGLGNERWNQVACSWSTTDSGLNDQNLATVMKALIRSVCFGEVAILSGGNLEMWRGARKLLDEHRDVINNQLTQLGNLQDEIKNLRDKADILIKEKVALKEQLARLKNKGKKPSKTT